jgi:hypothetical protein
MAFSDPNQARISSDSDQRAHTESDFGQHALDISDIDFSGH